LLQGLATGPVFVAGHSLGGGFAQVLAASHPKVVKGLVLVSACAKLPPGDGAGRFLQWVPEPFRRVRKGRRLRTLYDAEWDRPS
jgi:pimeloyl-ACP methyl ester carboxylesterase